MTVLGATKDNALGALPAGAQPRSMFDSIKLTDIPSILPLLNPGDKAQLLAELDKLEELKAREIKQKKFLAFVKA